MNLKFYLKLSFQEAAGVEDSSIRDVYYFRRTQILCHTGQHYWSGPQSLIEACTYALPEALIAHVDRIVLEDHGFTSVQQLHQGIYELKLDGHIVKAELNRRSGTYGDPDLYELTVVTDDTKGLPIALGFYDQIRQGKAQPVKSWDGPLPTS